MKEIDVSKAADWSAEEADYNIKYLEDRTRFDEAAKARELREAAATKTTKKTAKDEAE